MLSFSQKMTWAGGFLVALTGIAGAEKAVRVELRVEPGLRFSVPRFQVPADAAVELIFENTDQMMHNLVIARPGTRIEVVNAALQLAEKGPEMNFVPETDSVLWYSRVLSPGETETLKFRSPKEAGVYPYVCTYPGHGFIMYGAMYVGEEELPLLEEDPHVPPPLPELPGGSPFLQSVNGAKVVREFMPDCGPAAIAVGFPGGQSLCWDAGECRLRYAWSGGFIDVPYRKKDTAEVLGEVYYRAKPEEGLRIGESEDREVEFLGYRLVETYPEFRYRLNGVEVRESIRPRVDGKGVTRHFEIDDAKEASYVIDPDHEAVLKLAGQKAGEFTVTIMQPENEEGE